MEDLNIQERLELIEQRNQRVELDKAWETSNTRRLAIAVITYLVVVIFFVTLGFDNPFVNAIVPTLGFLLSTLSLSLIKKYWMQLNT